ncbi:kinase [Luteimonas sp. RIT-PG2_3]
MRGFAPALVATLLDDALAGHVRGHAPRIYGISGLQGTGKSTLAAQLVEAAQARGLRAVSISIDDVYLDQPERQQLAREVHPLLATRGPPGTHDVALACRTLDALRAGERVELPRFDKLGDRRRPRAQWTPCDAVDLVVFEGWFLGTTAETGDALVEPVNALERNEDADGRWRRWCNDALARDYPALWARIDRLLFLQPPGFDVVREWRWQQECALTATAAQAGEPAPGGMTRPQVDRFVQHYERVSRQALRTLPALAASTIALDAARRPLPAPAS